MTVNSSCSALLFTLFLASVFNIQNIFLKVSGDDVCSYPYTCMTTSECGEKHSARGTEEVLFHCDGRVKVCCPPVKRQCNAACEEKNVHSHHATEHSIYVNYTETSYQPNRKNASESNNKTSGEHRPDISVVEHHIHGTQRPNESKQQPSFQPPESRRPPEYPQRPHTPSTQTKKPQTSQSSTPSSNLHRPTSTQSPPYQIQASKVSLTSHKNFNLLPNESNCGVNNFANRITEGEEVSLGEYPWMVLTGLKDKYGNYRWNCGGTLINERYVLTAAHCLMVDNRTIEYVRLGEHSLTNETDCFRETCLDPPEDIKIAEVIPHENWNTTTIKNDIALLRLSRNPLSSGKSNIYPICLPFDMKKLNISSNTKYEVAGWGKTDWNADEGSDVLRKASLSGMNREECNICKDKKKQQYCPITDTQLCVQGWKSVDVCKGDSGGPLMVTRLNIYQIGITSFKGSEFCGAENIPSIFTKVESFLPWILDNIRK